MPPENQGVDLVGEFAGGRGTTEHHNGIIGGYPVQLLQEENGIFHMFKGFQGQNPVKFTPAEG